MSFSVGRCTVVPCLDELPALLGRGDTSRIALVFDESLAGNPGLSLTKELIGIGPEDMFALGMRELGGMHNAFDLSRELTGRTCVVALGGGSLMDTAKLALALRDPLVARVVRAPARGGWVLGPDRPRDGVMVAVPSTVGTAAEVSAVASFTDGSRKRAYTSVALQPDWAVLDPRATAGMPQEVLVEGGLEIVLRCVGPVVGADGPLTGTDRSALDLATQGTRLLSSARSEGAADADVRSRLARLSAMSQHPDLIRERAPFTVRAWFLANNLSHRLGVRKMAALANLLPACWERASVLPALGSPDRVRAVWEALRRHIPAPVSADPAAGFSEWLDWLGVPGLPALDEETRNDISDSCVRMWGGGLPMLSGISGKDIRELLRGIRVQQLTTQTPVYRYGS